MLLIALVAFGLVWRRRQAKEAAKDRTFCSHHSHGESYRALDFSGGTDADVKRYEGLFMARNSMQSLNFRLSCCAWTKARLGCWQGSCLDLGMHLA